MKHPILEKSKIIKATVIALVVGALLLVVAVLPAEYGIDPTGAGKVLGFSKLYVPESNQTDDLGMMVSTSNLPLIKLEKAGSGPDVARPVEAEFKINMLKYGTMKYEWTTANNEVLYFDFHGEVKQKEEVKEVYFESYTISNSHNMVGTFLAPYEGKHGWFFRNTSNEDVTVNLRLKGQYTL